MAGSGTAVSGTGTEGNPYVVDVVGSDISGTIAVQDTTTVDMTLAGSGSSADPYVLSATSAVAMTDLTDVTAGDVPATGDVPVWNGVSWDFSAPPTTPPGAVNVGAGLAGDGSAADPLEVAVSGTWGAAPLDTFGTNTLLGAPTYIDANGQLRTQPRGIDVVADGARPSQYPGRVIVESGTHEAYWSDGTTWQPFDTGPVWGHAGLTSFVTLTTQPTTLPTTAQGTGGGMTFDTATRSLVVPQDGLYRLVCHAYGTGGGGVAGWIRSHLRISTAAGASTVFCTVQLHRVAALTNDLTAGASCTIELVAGARVSMLGLSSAAALRTWGATGYDGAYFEVTKVG